MTSSKPKGGLGTSMKAMGGQGLGALFGNTGVTAPAPENVRDKVQEIAVGRLSPTAISPARNLMRRLSPSLLSL